MEVGILLPEKDGENGGGARAQGVAHQDQLIGLRAPLLEQNREQLLVVVSTGYADNVSHIYSFQ